MIFVTQIQVLSIAYCYSAIIPTKIPKQSPEPDFESRDEKVPLNFFYDFFRIS